MAKDPAILFYTSDFLSGTAFFTDEQRGQYIKLLCEQHQNGHIPESHLFEVCKYDGNTVVSPVVSKFVKDEEGKYYNERMEKEILKRQKFCNHQRDNILKRWNKQEEPIKIDTTVDTMVIPLENGNENDSSSSLGIIEEYWEKWKNYKKAEFGFYFNDNNSELEAKKELLRLCENDTDMAMKIIDYTIACGYKKFVKPEKDKKHGKGSTTTLEERAGIAATVFGTNSTGNSGKH